MVNPQNHLTIVKKIILAGLAAATLWSCQQEQLEPVKTPSTPNITATVNHARFPKNTQDIEALLANPEDQEDEKINRYLYELGLATRALIRNPEFNQTIINLAKKSETQSANLLDLRTVAPTFYQFIDTQLKIKGLSLAEIAENLTYQPTSEHSGIDAAQAEKYIPAIFIPNLERASANVAPIISPNIEANADEDARLEDHIVAWRYNEGGTIEEVLVNEEMALNTTTPLYLIDNAVESLKVKADPNAQVVATKPDPVAEPSGQRSHHHHHGLSFSSYEHSIRSQSYRYERFGKSDFTVTAVRIDPSGQPHLIYQAGNGTFRTYQSISEIHRNDIGPLRYAWRHHASDWQPWSNPWTPNAIQTGVNMVYWNTFERDWNHSLKPLGSGNANNATIYLSGNMKYNHEWYTWIPNSVQVHYTRFRWIYDNYAHWNDSWKARFRLWRVGA